MKYTIDFINKKSRIAFKNAIELDCFCNKQLSVKLYDSAVVVPANLSWEHYHTGILDKNGNLIRNSMLFESLDDDWTDSAKLCETKVCHDNVIYIGWISQVWGHILTDDLKKLWYLKTEECRELISKGYKIIATIPFETNAIKEIFKLADIDYSSIINIRTQTRFKNIIIPDDSIIENSNGLRTYTKEYIDIVRIIINKLPETESTAKLYFSRSRFSKSKTLWKREFGEKIIENVFRKCGYKIVYPENNSIIDNLTLLRNCESFASTEGSISHNVLFCKPNTEVVLVRKIDYVNSWQLIINHIADVRVTYIDAHKSIISHGVLGPYYMCVTKELERFYGKSILHVPYYLCPSFLWYLIQNRRIVKRILSLFGITY